MTSRIVLAVISLVLSFSLTVIAKAETVPVCPALNSDDFGPNDYLKGTFAGKDGWLSAPSDLNQKFERPNAEQLKRLVDALKARGTQLVVVVMPTRPMVYPEKMPDGALSVEQLTLRQNNYHAMIEVIRDSGALATDNLDVLLEAKAQGDVFFPTDTHWTILGAHSVAAAVSDMLRRDPGFPNSNLSFLDKPQPERPYPGSYQRIVQSKCHDNSYPQGTISPIETVKASDPNVGLFGDIPPPKIVLAGTSYSAKTVRDLFNFGGALQHYSGEEVLNVSVSGGGLYASLFNYLSSDDFHKSPPKYLIWETSRSFRAGAVDKTSQLIGTINGQCAENAKFSGSSDDGKPVHIFVENSAGVYGPEYYLSISLDDKSVTTADIQFLSVDRKSDHISIGLPAEADARGELFTELPLNLGDINEIIVAPAQASKGSYTVDLCSTAVNSKTSTAIFPTLPPALTAETQTPTSMATTPNSSITLEVIAFGDQFQGSPILAFELDGEVVLRQPIDATSRNEPQKVTLTIPVGTMKIRMRLDNDINNGRGLDRNIQIVRVAVDGKVILANTLTGAGSSARILENGDYRITGGSKWTQVPLSSLGASLTDRSCSNVSTIEVGPFLTGDITVPQSSLDQLKEIVASLKENQTCSVTLTGWSSASGSVAGNLDLAMARATNVSQLLMSLGVNNQVIFGAPQILTEGGPIVRLEYGTAP